MFFRLPEFALGSRRFPSSAQLDILFRQAIRGTSLHRVVHLLRGNSLLGDCFCCQCSGEYLVLIQVNPSCSPLFRRVPSEN